MKLVDSVVWDWNEIEGDTITGKYEQLYLLLHDETRKLSTNNGPFCIMCSTPFNGVFQATKAFLQIGVSYNVNGILVYQGVLSYFWDLWLDFFMPFDEILVCNDSEMVKITVANFMLTP